MQILHVAGMVLALMSPQEAAAGATQVQGARIKLDEELTRETVEGVADVVDREYFDRELASLVKAKLREELERGRYTGIQSAEELVERLTEDMYAITKDKHLSERYSHRDEMS